MVKFILIKSPDEWATTKQACRDELVVYLFFLPYIYIVIYNIKSSTYIRLNSVIRACQTWKPSFHHIIRTCLPRIMALQLHPYNNHARVTAEINRNAHSKEAVWKKMWCIKQQLPQKQQRKIMSDSPQISKNGTETIKRPSGTPAKETKPSYPNTSGTSKTEKSRFTSSGES